MLNVWIIGYETQSTYFPEMMRGSMDGSQIMDWEGKLWLHQLHRVRDVKTLVVM